MTEEKYRAFDLSLKIFALIGAGVSFIVGISSYERQLADESAKEFWQKQFPIYITLCQTTSRIATTTDSTQLVSAKQRFWEMYYGEAAMVYDDSLVFVKMNQFATRLMELESKNEELLRIHLRDDSYELAYACKRSMALTWNTPLSAFQNKN